MSQQKGFFDISLVFLLITVFFLLLTGCGESDESEAGIPVSKEQIGGGATTPALPSSAIDQFYGISSISDISQTEVKINWEHIPGIAAYIILSIENGVLVYNKTVNAPKNSAKIKNLEDDREYIFVVWPMSLEGEIFKNSVEAIVTTLAYDPFNNTEALTFGDNQFVELPSSKEIIGTSKQFSISVWFKTVKKQGNDSRLITFHRGNSPSSAINIALNGDSVSVGYRDEDNIYRRIHYHTEYFDDQWHNITASYNGKEFKLYYDFINVEKVSDSFTGFGRSPAIIGSFDGRNNFLDDVFVDEVSVWKRALSKKDVFKLQLDALPADLNRHKKYKHLRAWWRFGDHLDDSGLRLKDQARIYDGVPINF